MSFYGSFFANVNISFEKFKNSKAVLFSSVIRLEKLNNLVFVNK